MFLLSFVSRIKIAKNCLISHAFLLTRVTALLSSRKLFGRCDSKVLASGRTAHNVHGWEIVSPIPWFQSTVSLFTGKSFIRVALSIFSRFNYGKHTTYWITNCPIKGGNNRWLWWSRTYKHSVPRCSSSRSTCATKAKSCDENKRFLKHANEKCESRRDDHDIRFLADFLHITW